MSCIVRSIRRTHEVERGEGGKEAGRAAIERLILLSAMVIALWLQLPS